MTYLYGDSTPSPLQSNFIELLRRALDCSVALLQADRRLADGRDVREARRRRGEEELERLEAFATAVAGPLDSARIAPEETPVSRSAKAIAAAAAEVLRGEREAIKGAIAQDLGTIDADAARERAACLRALEALVLKHDLPDAASTIELAWEGTRYVGRLRQKTPYGVELAMELEVPASNAFAHDVRVERLIEGLEIHAPEQGGVFRKQVRLTPHKLGKHHVTLVVVSPGETHVNLRESQEKHAGGFDVVMRKAGVKLEVSRIGKDGEMPLLDISDAELGKYAELDERVRGAVEELAGGARKALVEARLAGRSLTEADHPAELVERLVAAMAPVVQEIARRSLTATELVLKRAVAGDRREEIFVSKAEMLGKLDPLPEAQRALFAPLGLGGGGDALAVGSAQPVAPAVAPAAAPVAPVAPAAAPPAPSRPSTVEISVDDGDVVELEAAEPEPEARVAPPSEP